ncbi:MAG: hypothetical protein ABMA64_22310 [Myxococcota bacterium]
MWKVKYDNARFAEEAARVRAEAAAVLAATEAAAIAAGKEPFDLEVLDRCWRDNPDARHAALGVAAPPDERRREWAHRYYVLYPEVRTNAAFVAAMKALQGEGAFD